MYLPLLKNNLLPDQSKGFGGYKVSHTGDQDSSRNLVNAATEAVRGASSQHDMLAGLQANAKGVLGLPMLGPSGYLEMCESMESA